MERNTTHQTSAEDLTPIEALLQAAGLPAVEVDACPVADCEFCHHALPRAA